MKDQPELSVVPDPEEEPTRPPGIAPELSLLVAGIDDQTQRNSVITALFDFSRGQPDGFTVKFAVLLKALTLMVGVIPVLVKKAFSKEAKTLQASLIAYQTSVKDSTIALNKAITASAEQIESLKKEIRQMQNSERMARAEESRLTRNQIDDLRRAIPDVQKAAHLVSEVHYRVVWITAGVAFCGGVVLLLLMQHLVFHLF